jgi:RNA polymerase sigma-70 factor (ECF subfamily)
MLALMDTPDPLPAHLEAALEQVRPRVEAFIESRLGPELRRFVEPCDLLQETMLRALRAKDQFTAGSADELFRWLCGIAQHALQEAARRRQRDAAAPLGLEPPGTGTSPEARSRRDERFERLQAALDELSPDHRQVILLARIERLPMKEVAQRMGRTPEAATQLLWRALQRLKRGFGTTDSFGLPDRRLEDRGGAP